MGTSSKWVIRFLAFALLTGIAWFAYHNFYEKVDEEDNGEVVTRIIWSRMREAPSVRVSNLTGEVQGVAVIRAKWLGSWFDTRQEARFPFDVDYFIDLKSIHLEDLHWNSARKELRIDLPDVAPGRPNVDEGRRTDVRTTGVYVSRKTGAELARKVSADATQKATQYSRRPEKMDRAREHARTTFGKYFSMPLVAAGYGDARVIVTFPPERAVRDGDQWDRTASINEALANGRQQR